MRASCLHDARFGLEARWTEQAGCLCYSESAFHRMEPAGAERHRRAGRRPSERERTSQTPYSCRAAGVSRLSAGSYVIAGMFMAIFERELGDSRLIELAQAFRDHAVVLFFGCASEW